jgi:hypothetical protein
MLLILIPIAWLAVVTLVVAACQSASRADMRLLAASAGDHSSAVGSIRQREIPRPTVGRASAGQAAL